MDKKVRELIEPFKDWDTAQLSFGTLMTTIDAIVESRNEKLKGELIDKIQKLQIEKTFLPKTADEEKPCEKSKEDEYKIAIVNILTDNFKSELKTLTNIEYYNDMNWFVNVPSFNINYIYEMKKPYFNTNYICKYCNILKEKLDALINSVKFDSSSNVFYITRRKKDRIYSIYYASTIILHNPKTCIVTSDLSSKDVENNDIIKIAITDDKGNTNVFQLKYHCRDSIIECNYPNPNFMLFDPITREYVLFYKSHKSLCVNHDDKILTSLKNKDEDKKVNDEEVEIDEDVNDEKSRKRRAKEFGVFLKAKEDKRIKTRNTLKELFSEVIMTITNEKEVNENFTYSKCNLQTLKKYIRKYIRNLICKISDSEPLYIYSKSINNKYMEKSLTCYHARNYRILPDNTSNNYYFDINIDCISHNVTIPITFFDGENTYFLSVRNKDSENKSYNFAIVNIKTKDFIVFTKDKFVFDDWKLEITAER